MIVKVHKQNEKTIVAICDEVLLGKIFEEGDLILDLSSSFYAGVKMTEQEAGDLLRNANIVNLVGEKSIALGKSEDIIDEGKTNTINGIPYAQSVLD